MRRLLSAPLVAAAALVAAVAPVAAGAGSASGGTTPATLTLPSGWLYGQPETVSGAGLPASQQGTVWVLSGATPTAVTTFSTSASGTFTASPEINELAPGVDTFQVVVGQTYNQSQVLASAQSTILPATLTLANSTPGYLTLIPTNFGTDEVHYYLDGTYISTPGVDPGNAQLPLPAGISPGLHTVTAWPFYGGPPGQPPSGPISATATFTVSADGTLALPGTVANAGLPATARYDLFAVQSTGQLYQEVRVGSWSTGWQGLQGPPAGWLPAVAAVKAGARYDIFGASSDGQLYQLVWTGSMWTQVSSQGAPSTGLVGGVAATQVGGRYDVFAVGHDGQAYQKTWTGTAWTGWGSLGAPAVGLIGGLAATQSAGRWDIFGVGTDGNLYQKVWTGTTWTGWTSQGSPGGPIGSGVAVNLDSGRYDIFAARVDGVVFQKVWTGSSWTGWTSQGTAYGPYQGGIGGPLAVTEAGGRYDIFGMGAYGPVLRTWTGATWTDWNVDLNLPRNGDGLLPGIAAIRS